jgi:hypothetical protein
MYEPVQPKLLDHLAGLSLARYNEDLMDLVARLVVAPMATKYMFWKKVQSVAQLKHRYEAGQHV